MIKLVVRIFSSPYLQDIFKSNNCRSDYLEIRDGYWHKSPILGKFCGSGKVNDLIKSTGSRMLLTYTTTFRQINMRGFAASYEGEYFEIRILKL